MAGKGDTWMLVNIIQLSTIDWKETIDCVQLFSKQTQFQDNKDRLKNEIFKRKIIL